MRATLEHVLTAEAFERTIPLASRFADGVQAVIDEHGLPWNVTQLGCRAEYQFLPEPPRDGTERARRRTTPSWSATCTSTRSTAA